MAILHGKALRVALAVMRRLRTLLQGLGLQLLSELVVVEDVASITLLDILAPCGECGRKTET